MMQITCLAMSISLYFKGSSKLLICGGYTNSKPTNQCEVIDLNSNRTCKNPPNYPTKVVGAIGGLEFKEDPIICRGSQDNSISKKCYSLENNSWVSSQNMNTARVNAAVAQLQDGKLLVTGGLDDYLSGQNSSNLLTKDGWESKIPPLPVNIIYHCMVPVNSTTIMVIGGYQNIQYYSGKTFFFTFGEEIWTEGPTLENARRIHSCGKIRRDKASQKMSIIVAGGFDGSSMSSVEILAEGFNEWQRGPELPFGISNSKMIEDQKGGVVLIGGYSSHGFLDTLYRLPHAGLGANWTKMVQNLQIPRCSHTTFLVPDNVADCS